jgi:hypothetical protein
MEGQSSQMMTINKMISDEDESHECYLPVENGGCVTKEAKMNFLENKCAPASDPPSRTVAVASCG